MEYNTTPQIKNYNKITMRIRKIVKKKESRMTGENRNFYFAS